MRLIKVISYILIVLASIYFATPTNSQNPQEEVTVKIFADRESLTFVIESQEAVSLSELVIVYFDNQENEKKEYYLQNEPNFRVLDFDDLPSTICFRLQISQSTIPPPVSCQNVNNRYQQIYNPNDTFWFDINSGNVSTLNILRRTTDGDISVIACQPTTGNVCEVDWNLEEGNTPLPTLTSSIILTETATAVALPTMTQTSSPTPSVPTTVISPSPRGQMNLEDILSIVDLGNHECNLIITSQLSALRIRTQVEPQSNSRYHAAINNISQIGVIAISSDQNYYLLYDQQEQELLGYIRNPYQNISLEVIGVDCQNMGITDDIITN